MKLLIVDDEELTRTGVISSIDWQSIGIQEVLQADDGINGIEMARVHRPDIVLCDVRMPRLDGIAMLEQLEEILPDIVPVFMSGYSDKEYLKAAIKLKAVNYIAVSYTHLNHTSLSALFHRSFCILPLSHASEGLPPPAAGGPAHGLSYGTCFHKSHLW